MEPTLVVSKKHTFAKATDFNLCIVCQKYLKGDPGNLRPASDGINRLKEIAKERWQLHDYDNTDVIDRLSAVESDEGTSESKKIQYHKECYSTFTSSSTITRLKKAEQKATCQPDKMTGGEPR